MHQKIQQPIEKHDVFVLIEEDESVAFGKVSYTQILLLELTGFIRKNNETEWKVLGETPFYYH